ncbi:nucleotidyltransferase family protein [Sphingobacterium suaedae]|uniref:Nucleotidyltransferase family protein n=1 Tax=Sphingobacterium suaedae TaxID=1686402 RepID=A0ABW5KMH8_9SPHI
MKKEHENKITETFLELLRAGLWNREPDLECLLPLTSNEWSAVHDLAKKQTVEGLVFAGVQKLNDLQHVDRQMIYRLVIRVEAIERANSRMNDVIMEQSAFFSQQSLNPILLKGQGVARHYIEPLRRVCGDIDWYFSSPEEFRAAFDLLIKTGIRPSVDRSGNFVYNWKGQVVDHHRKMFDSYGPFSRRSLQEIERELNPVNYMVQGCPVMVPAPTVEVIQVTLHILKHMLAFGVGIRQICDIARLYVAHAHSVDGQMLKKVYQSLRVDKWVNLLHNTLVNSLGMSTSLLPFGDCPPSSDDRILNDVLNAGNFGFFNGQTPDMKNNIQGKSRSLITVMKNTARYLPYAPFEAVSFPFTHFFSDLLRAAKIKKYK